MSEARDSVFLAANQRQVEQLAKLGWYHSIELPDGSVIPGLQSIERLRTRLQQFHIPEDLTGKRVLDIGAWDGWFSFEMERRGASVLAVDSARNTRLLEARSLLGSRIDYQVADICHLTAREVGTFDIVLFLGVLYHLKHPLLALENVCGMCREMACIESFVTDGDPDGIPLMEFYETAELRGQLDNWCGPNTACLLAFARTAGFARVQFESVLGERAHVSAYRKWNATPGEGVAPQVLCIANSTIHDHNFSSAQDDYLTFYFSSASQTLACDSVFAEVGGYGSRPIHVARSGEGWQANCKVPPGLDAGWHVARLRVEGSRWSAPLRIGIDVVADITWVERTSNLQITKVADGKTFESGRIRVGENSSLSVWVTGLPEKTMAGDVCVRLNGTDLPAVWLAPEGDIRQVNALLPAGLKSGSAVVSVVLTADGTESHHVAAELYG